jgi:two-component system, NarL family, response regulator LiaR
MAPVRVQLVSDDQMLADALGLRLAREGDGFLVGHSTSDVAHTVTTARTHGTGVLLVDAATVAGHWSAVVQAVAHAQPHVRAVVLADEVNAEDALLAALHSVSAWLTPEVSAGALVEVLRHVGDGYAFYPPAVLGVVLRRLVANMPERHEPGEKPLAALSGREREVLGLLMEGRGGREIAELLGIRASTVQSHIDRILRKLAVHSRAEAVRVARDGGLARSPTPGS